MENSQNELNEKTTSEIDSQLCGFKIADAFYAIPVLEVQEVIRAQDVTVVPCSPGHIKGLINLRGQVVTSISLRNLFKMDELERTNYMNIIVRSGESLYALRVDEILDVMSIEKSIFEKTPNNLSEDVAKYISGVFKLKDKLLITLDLKKIISQENK